MEIHIKCEQKICDIEGKHIAYVETTIVDTEAGYDYRVLFDKNTKKRFNAFLTSVGFKIGAVNDVNTVPDKKLYI